MSANSTSIACDLRRPGGQKMIKFLPDNYPQLLPGLPAAAQLNAATSEWRPKISATLDSGRCTGGNR